MVERANAPVIYLSTDAAESETGLLQSLVVVDGKVVPLVKRPPRNSAEKWDSLLYRHGIEDDSQVMNATTKTLIRFLLVYGPKTLLSRIARNPTCLTEIHLEANPVTVFV